MRIPSLTCCQLRALPQLSIFTSLAPEQIPSLSSKQPVASGEGALECSAGVWDITAQLPGFGISRLSSLGSHKRRLQAGRARPAPAAPAGDGIPGVTPPLPGWRLRAIPASRTAEKGSSLGNRGCSSSGIRLCSKLSQNELLQQRFCLQVKGKNKSCGKAHDFYLEQIFFGCWKFSWRTHRGKGRE